MNRAVIALVSLLLLVALPVLAASVGGGGASGWLERHVAAVAPLLARWGYLAVFVAVAVEGFGIPAPGQTLLIAGSLAAAADTLRIEVLILTALAATLAGSGVGYAIGRWGGRRLFTRIGLASERLDGIEQRFARWGAAIVVVGRFIDGLRQLNAPVAGALEMPFWRFMAANVVGAMLWIGLWGLGPWLVEEDMPAIIHFAKHSQRWLIGGALIVAIVAGIHLWRRRHAETEPNLTG
jgi:membrane protein DedA with SNARE-associated domain